MMKVFLDTCIVLDALQNRQPWAEASKELFLTIADGVKLQGYMSAKAITDIYYILRKALGSEEQARQEIQKLLKLFVVLDTTVDDLQNAIESPCRDYEDGVASEIAKRNGVDYLCTRNKKDYVIQGSPHIVDADELLKLIRFDEENDSLQLS